MPWTPRQKRYLLSDSSPLSEAHKERMRQELHNNPELGHAEKSDTETHVWNNRKRKGPRRHQK